MKLFLDDERFPADVTWMNSQEYFSTDWQIVRNQKEFFEFIDVFGLPNHISFDHDLGKNEPTGYDIARKLVDYIMDHDLQANFIFAVHSKNPVGKKNIEMLINNFMEKWN